MEYCSIRKRAWTTSRAIGNAIVMVLLTKITMVLGTVAVICHVVGPTKAHRRRNSNNNKKYRNYWSNAVKPETNRELPPQRRGPGARLAVGAAVHATDATRYEHLCATEAIAVHLSTSDEEYQPPFYHEIRCVGYRRKRRHHHKIQKCGFGLLHCVQTYRRLYFSRRKAGTDCWQPYYIDAPSGCECMWPVEDYGPLNHRQEL
uniref:EMI domain-containing protein n=1 Tax=Trichuris muris TaxID=70415 RepID=A0A5S6PZI9_TRIMR